MAYTSPDLERAIHGGMPIVEIGNANELAASSKSKAAGYESRPWKEAPLGYAAPAMEATEIEIYTESELVEIIKMREANGTTNRHLKALAGFKSRSQGQTNNCWACAGAQGLRYVAAKSGTRIPDYCPMSTSSRMTGYKDVGGWSGKFVESLYEFGINTTAEWPWGKFGKANDTQASRRQALKRVACEHKDLPVQGMSQKQRKLWLWSIVVQIGPVAFGADWMRHAVLAVDPVLVNGKLAGYCDNSGLYRDNNGVTVFGWSKCHYDDAVVPTSIRMVA